MLGLPSAFSPTLLSHKEGLLCGSGVQSGEHWSGVSFSVRHDRESGTVLHHSFLYWTMKV